MDDELSEIQPPPWRRIPVAAWLAIALAVVIGANQWRIGGRPRVPVIGNGPVTQVESAHQPGGVRYSIETIAGSVDEGLKHVEKRLRLRPDVAVTGVDISGLPPKRVRSVYRKLMKMTERATQASVIVGPLTDDEALRTWFRGDECRKRRRQICVDAGAHQTPDGLRLAIAAAVGDAVVLMRRYQASTQRGR